MQCSEQSLLCAVRSQGTPMRLGFYRRAHRLKERLCAPGDGVCGCSFSATDSLVHTQPFLNLSSLSCRCMTTSSWELNHLVWVLSEYGWFTSVGMFENASQAGMHALLQRVPSGMGEWAVWDTVVDAGELERVDLSTSQKWIYYLGPRTPDS